MNFNGKRLQVAAMLCGCALMLSPAGAAEREIDPTFIYDFRYDERRSSPEGSAVVITSQNPFW